MEKAAKCNKMSTENIRTNLENAQDAKPDNSAKGSVFDLVRTKNLRIKTLCMNFNWFVCGLCFFGVSQYVGETGGNIFKNVAISASLEIPGQSDFINFYLILNDIILSKAQSFA